jgi:hypothetical protein
MGSTARWRHAHVNHGLFHFSTERLIQSFKRLRSARRPPNPDGSWTETVLHQFNATDGYGPDSGLVFDKAGNLYGTTLSGGAYGYYGVVFELMY